MTIHLEYGDGSSRDFSGSPVRSVLLSAQLHAAPLRHDCGGKALCGTCRVRVLSGRGQPPDEREAQRLLAVGAAADERLACQLRPAQDLRLRPVLAPAPLPS